MTINFSSCKFSYNQPTQKSFGPWNRDYARATVAEWKQTVPLATPVYYQPKMRIYDQSSQSNNIFLLEQGLVALQREPRSGSRSGIFALCFPGYLFGYPFLELAHLYKHSAIALTHCVVHPISAQELSSALVKGGEKAISVIRLYLQNLFCSQVRSTELATQDARARFERLLIDLASVLGNRNPADLIRLPLMDKDIASLLGISPERLSVIKRQMTEDKVIARSQQRKAFVLKSDTGKVRFYKSHYSQGISETV